jgi:hypothetical protein
VTVPATHLIWGEARNDAPVRIQEVVPLAAPVAKLRGPTLAGCESETPLAAAGVMNNGHRLMKLVDVAVSDRITSCKTAADRSTCDDPQDALHGSNETEISHD